MWTCPDCGAPFANANASHSCVSVELDRHFEGTPPRVREAFDRLIELADPDHLGFAVVAQKTRIVVAAPMRYLAVTVRRNRLVGHVLLDRVIEHPVVYDIKRNAYESGLALHRFSIRDASELDAAFAAMLAEGARRVGRRARLTETKA